MTTRSVRVLFPLAVSIVLVEVPVVDGAPQAQEIQKLAEARVAAGRKAYEETTLLYREGRSRDLDRIYLWSKRWLDAQLDVSNAKADQEAAYEAHWKRMKQLEDLIDRRMRSGVGAAIEVPQVQYYRLEAELWLARARKK